MRRERESGGLDDCGGGGGGEVGADTEIYLRGGGGEIEGNTM